MDNKILTLIQILGEMDTDRQAFEDKTKAERVAAEKKTEEERLILEEKIKTITNIKNLYESCIKEIAATVGYNGGKEINMDELKAAIRGLMIKLKVKEDRETDKVIPKKTKKKEDN